MSIGPLQAQQEAWKRRERELLDTIDNLRRGLRVDDEHLRQALELAERVDELLQAGQLVAGSYATEILRHLRAMRNLRDPRP